MHLTGLLPAGFRLKLVMQDLAAQAQKLSDHAWSLRGQPQPCTERDFQKTLVAARRLVALQPGAWRRHQPHGFFETPTPASPLRASQAQWELLAATACHKLLAKAPACLRRGAALAAQEICPPLDCWYALCSQLCLRVLRNAHAPFLQSAGRAAADMRSIDRRAMKRHDPKAPVSKSQRLQEVESLWAFARGAHTYSEARVASSSAASLELPRVQPETLRAARELLSEKRPAETPREQLAAKRARLLAQPLLGLHWQPGESVQHWDGQRWQQAEVADVINTPQTHALRLRSGGELVRASRLPDGPVMQQPLLLQKRAALAHALDQTQALRCAVQAEWPAKIPKPRAEPKSPLPRGWRLCRLRQCPTCKAYAATVHYVQLRASDEASAAFADCAQCGTTQRIHI